MSAPFFQKMVSSRPNWMNCSLSLFHFSHPQTFQLTHIKNTAVCANKMKKLLFPAGIHRTFAPTNRISSAKCEWITFNNKKVKRYEKTD